MDAERWQGGYDLRQMALETRVLQMQVGIVKGREWCHGGLPWLPEPFSVAPVKERTDGLG
jgi:hypothetical protein